MNRKDEILEAYNFRFACKEFDSSKKISDEDFNFILEVARLSPSSIGLEPWRFLVIQNKALRDKLLPYCTGAKTQLPTASHFVIILARSAKDLKYDSEYIDHILKDIKQFPESTVNGFKEFLKNFQNELFDGGNDEKGIFNWASRQTYIAMGNMMTVAAELKIDSCAIEGFNKEKVEEVLVNEGILDKEHFGISVMIAFGYRKEENLYKKSRQELKEIVQFV